MADKKITELTNITGANLVDADEFVVVDISADETKAITLGELKEAFDSGSGFVRITGDTMTGDLALSGADVTFGDNDKAIFGAGSDLEIYHDGSNSIIREGGTGALRFQANGPYAEIMNGGATETMARFNNNGSVDLYYDNAPKLVSTSTGVDIKNVASGANAKLNITTESTGGGTSEILFSDNTTGRGRIYYDHGSSPEELHIETTGTDAIVIDNSQNVTIPNGNLDITGTLTSDGLTVAGNLSVDGGTIKLDGNYPVGTDNVALGDTALDSGSLSGGWNVAVGTNALTANTTGNQNVAVGSNAADGITTGANNVSIGRETMGGVTTGDANTVVGSYAMYSAGTDPDYNTAIGNSALAFNQADNNTAVGYEAGYSNTTAGSITAVGHSALYSNTTGDANTALGRNALYLNTTGGQNVASGLQALYSNTTGSYNTATGREALFNNTTASQNTAVGYQAGYFTTTSNRLTVLGQQAGYGQQTGSENTYVGYQSGPNTVANASGSFNTSLGAFSLYSNTTASNNTAVGYQAGYSNTTGTQNTAIGSQALDAATTGSNTVAIGSGALGSSTTGSENLAVGVDAGRDLTTGLGNTFVGRGNATAAGYLMTTGSKNTIIGGYSGNSGGLDIRTSSNNIVLSDGDGTPYVAIGPFNSAVEDKVNAGAIDTILLGRVGGDAVRATGVVIGDIFGANYLIAGGGYDLTFSKAVATDGNTTPTSYAAALTIQGSDTTDNTPDVHVNNTLSKGSGSFRIEHPLPSMSQTHDLVHSFIEGPKADLIYRGKVDLVNGTASVDIDTESTMTTGTFEVLCRDVQCFTSNETGWTAVKGSVTGNVLTIVAQENTCTDTVSWMVVGERKDPKMRSSSLTDDDGNMIVEPLKRVESVIDYENA